MSLRAAVLAQFGNPQGPLGHLVGLVMARRPSNRQRGLWTVDLLGIQPGDRILEVGCGPGVALGAAAARALSGETTGLDRSATMLQQAARRNRAAIAAGRLKLVEGSVERVSEWPGRFDKIFSVNVVQFFAERQAALALLAKALRPGGTLVTTYMPRHRGADRDSALRMAAEISGHLSAAGLRDIRTEELPLGPVPAIAVIGRAAPARP
ncbi:MAG: methyltransferase domain-containing protein [Bauldia sp.]